MKFKEIKKYILILVMLFAVCLISGCSNEKENPDPEQLVETYEVIFDGRTTQLVQDGSLATAINAIEKEGYTFVGWFKDDELFDFSQPIHSNVNLTSHYEKKTVLYTVLFNIDGETNTVQVQENELLLKPADPIKIGYVFKGWYIGTGEFDFSSPITSDLKIDAKFEKIKFVVTINNDGDISKIECDYNEKILKPTPKEKTGYTFDNWYSDNVIFDFEKGVTDDIELEARYVINKYIVTFDNEGNKTTQEINYNSVVTKPSNPSKTGYTFDGWYLNNVKFNFDTKITSDITLVAKYNVNKYIVTFDNEGSKTTQEINYNGLATKPSTPTKTGYTFDGWYLNNVKFNFDTKITSDITLVAKYNINVYVVTFKVDGNKTTQNVNYNNVVSKPSNPSKPGYTFDGWYLNNVSFDFNTKITSDITLVAKFISLPTGINVTYDFGYECFQTKDDLRLAYYTDFYNFLITKNYNFAKYSINNLDDFLTFLDTWTYNGRSEMGFLGDAFGSYYLNQEVGGKIEDQTTDKFIGYCYQNNKYRPFLEHLMTFFAYWRTDEGYSQSDPNGNDFFASCWASFVDTAKFFHFTSSNLRDTYAWFNSERVDYALDHIPGVGYVTLTYNSKNPITLPTDVTRPNCDFLGWYDSAGNKVTVVNSSMTVYARWSSPCIYEINALTGNTYIGSSTNWYCATPSETANGYKFGTRLIIKQSGSNYVVSEIVAPEATISGDYAYRVVMYTGSYQPIPNEIQIGQRVVITQNGNYINFKFYNS